MDNHEIYSFCPKCGALMVNGVCPECHYGDYNKSKKDTSSRKPAKKNNVIAILCIVFAVIYVLSMLIGSFFYGYLVTKLATGGFGDGFNQEFHFEFGNSDRNGGTDGLSGDSTDNVPGNTPGDDASGVDALPQIDESGSEEDAEEAYVPDPSDEYYYGPCDYIDESVDYSFKSKSYSNEDEKNSIDIIINYYQLEGNIPNIDSLNETLENVAMYYAEEFPKKSKYAEYGNSYSAYITSYVTYNDADIISIVQDEYIVIDGQYQVDLYSINIDVNNGVILDNCSILDMDKAFAKEFIKRNLEQNGKVDIFSKLTEDQLVEAFHDKDAVIAYYTPLGMEIGFNYNTGKSVGWVSVTYKDYKKYISKF